MIEKKDDKFFKAPLFETPLKVDFEGQVVQIVPPNFDRVLATIETILVDQTHNRSAKDLDLRNTAFTVAITSYSILSSIDCPNDISSKTIAKSLKRESGAILALSKNVLARYALWGLIFPPLRAYLSGNSTHIPSEISYRLINSMIYSDILKYTSNSLDSHLIQTHIARRRQTLADSLSVEMDLSDFVPIEDGKSLIFRGKDSPCVINHAFQEVKPPPIESVAYLPQIAFGVHLVVVSPDYEKYILNRNDVISISSQLRQKLTALNTPLTEIATRLDDHPVQSLKETLNLLCGDLHWSTVATFLSQLLHSPYFTQAFLAHCERLKPIDGKVVRSLKIGQDRYFIPQRQIVAYLLPIIERVIKFDTNRKTANFQLPYISDSYTQLHTLDNLYPTSGQITKNIEDNKGSFMSQFIRTIKGRG